MAELDAALDAVVRAAELPHLAGYMELRAAAIESRNLILQFWRGSGGVGAPWFALAEKLDKAIHHDQAKCAACGGGK